MPSVCTLLVYSLECGRMPLEWKSENITPDLKKFLKEQVKIYCPISLPIVSKVLLRCVCSKFDEHVFILSLHINTVSDGDDLVLHSCATSTVALR